MSHELLEEERAAQCDLIRLCVALHCLQRSRPLRNAQGSTLEVFHGLTRFQLSSGCTYTGVVRKDYASWCHRTA